MCILIWDKSLEQIFAGGDLSAVKYNDNLDNCFQFATKKVDL